MKRKKLFSGLFLLGTIMLGTFSTYAQKLPVTDHPVTDAYDGWRIGTHAFSFRKFTFYEAIEKTASLGLNWIDAYPRQRLSPDNPDLKMDFSLSPEKRKEIKQKLADSGIKLVNYGTVGLSENETQCRKIFDFAKDMGIETIVSEPKEELLDMIEALCREYGINLALHNHPKPSYYWNPDKVLEVVKGRSPRIGSCSDIGHWMRSGINPLEALKKLEGRIISLHFKDLNQFDSKEAHDVPWGTGKADVKALLSELNRQNFKGIFSIEYEYNWDNSVPEIRSCVEYFNRIGSELKPSGWQDLFAKDLSNATFKPGTWTINNGVLALNGGSYIWTKNKYGDFILDLEFKLEKDTNSGVFLRAGDIAKFVQSSIEVQIHQSTDGTKYGSCGAIYDCMAPAKDMVFETGQWNHFTITCKANKIYVVFNGEQIIDMDLNLWTEPRKNPDGTRNKFRTAMKDMPKSGHIGFQDHGQPIWYRNIKIKKL